MLKPNGHLETVRRPTRINTYESNQQQQQDRLATNGFNSESIKKVNSSTITRVPSAAKSRLRQPVASAKTIKTPAYPSSNSVTVPKQNGAAKPSTRTIPCSRPTSLALACKASETTPRMVTSVPQPLARTSKAGPTNSTLPKLIRLPDTSSGSNTIRKGPLAKCTTKNQVSNASNTSHIQATVKRKCTSIAQLKETHTNASASASSRSGSSFAELRFGRLKNLVAVVHPQRSSQRVNSITSSTTTSKLALTTAPATISNMKIGSGGSSSSKVSGRCKVNSNHKVGHNREEQVERESKQDGAQIVASHIHLKTTATATSNASSSADTTERNDKQGDVPYSTPTSTPTTATTTPESAETLTLAHAGCENDQAASRDSTANNYLLSVESGGRNLHDDEQWTGNNKQSDKHLSGHTKLPTTKKIGQRQHQQLMKQTNGNKNKCYNHDGAKSTLTKSPADGCVKRSVRNCNHAINDRICPKPMGQQVLSLMMLDVGLLPAYNHNSHDHHQHSQQDHVPAKRSHVRVQSPTKLDLDHANGVGISSLLVDNGRAFINHHEKDPASRLNDSDSASESRNYGQQGNNYHSLQPGHDMLRLQVHFSNRAMENPRSVSLPTSPRIGRRTHRGGGLDRTNPNNQTFLRQVDSLRQLKNSLTHDRAVDQSKYVPSIVSSARDQSYLTDRLISVCDNQDSQSMTSSSCSSLNQCPPLLALSNQLDGLKFEDLVRANAIHNLGSGEPDKSNACGLIQAVSTMDRQQQRQQFMDQVVQVADQHEILTSGCDFEKQSSNNHAEASITQQSADLFAPDNSCFREQQTFKNSSMSTCSSLVKQQIEASEQNLQLDESSTHHQLSHPPMDPISRRQHQPRSHSIGGQEYHLTNGSYQRLKQSIYNQHQQQQQPLPFDGYNQNCANLVQPGHHRMHQTPSPYMQQSQQHQHVNGRSPSPLSVNCHMQYNSSPQREGSLKYPVDRQPRNHLHASLECLNFQYSDQNSKQTHKLQQENQIYPQQQHFPHQYYPSMQHQQQQHQNYLDQNNGLSDQHSRQQQQQQQPHDQPYATSYVLVTPPVNTVINSKGDQDLAAAAMETPPSRYHSIPNSNSPTPSLSAHTSQTQNLINRAMAQVSQSPLRRLGLNTTHANTASSGLLNHLSSVSHPMRAGHSSLSLASSSFIIEDKLQNEIKKLQSELKSEKEKNEALNSQLNINSSLMAAFEQSLTTLNTRLRQLTTLNEKKDNEIEELKEQLGLSKSSSVSGSAKDGSSPNYDSHVISEDSDNKWTVSSEKDIGSERDALMKTIDDLKRQLIEKDRLLTDTRLEALSAAHQLEQLESKMNGDHSLLANEDDLDEGVMVVNHSPSDSDAITDSHFSEINNQMNKSHQGYNGDNVSFSNNSSNNGSNNTSNNDTLDGQAESTIVDDHHSSYSSDYQGEVRDKDRHSLPESISQQFNEPDSGEMSKLIDDLLLTN